MENRSRLRDFPLRFYFEIAVLLSMLVTLTIPSVSSPIAIWSETSVLLFVRASVWLLGLVILSGASIFRLIKISKILPVIERSAIEINLSFVFIGLMALAFYSLRIDFALLPWFALSILSILDFIYWFKGERLLQPTKLEIAKWHQVLLVEVLVVVSLALLIQLEQQYLIPGDNWVVAKSAIEILSQRDLYQTFGGYPLMFGFVLSGLSVSSGMPVINTYVLLFPLAVLNIITFYALMKIVFSVNEKIATISSVLYGLGGGLGFLIQMIVFNGTKDFWTLSLISQDMYFFTFFWHSIQFSFKSLALTLCYASLILLVLSIRAQRRTEKILGIVFSSVFILFSFLIHMLEPIIFVPVIFALSYVYQNGRDRHIHFFGFVALALIIGYVIDTVTSGYYTMVTMDKIRFLILSLSYGKSIMYLALLPVLVSVLVLGIWFFPKQKISFHASQRGFSGKVKFLVAAVIAAVYVGGLWFWASVTPSLDISATFPWYRYVVRYGFVGGFAVVGLAVAKWKSKTFAIALFWSLTAILLGSLWWGERINSYLFPMIALFAAFGVDWIWTAGKRTVHLSIDNSQTSIGNFKFRLKPIAAILLAVIVGLSFTSFIYGARYYISSGPPTSDDEARAFAWIQQNVAENATVLVPTLYSTELGVAMIADRNILEYRKLPSTASTESLVKAFGLLKDNNVRYATTVKGYESPTPVVDNILSMSAMVYYSNDVKVYRLPSFSVPTDNFTVAAIDKELLGFLGDSSKLGWIDDDFKTGWVYSSVEATVDGETLDFVRSFEGEEVPVPSAMKATPIIDTNSYPYIMIRYRNTAETNIGVTQVVTLRNETGWQGVIQNVYLDYGGQNETDFTTAEVRLTPNQKVARMDLWLRNYGYLNGTVGLQIDYIAFASEEMIHQNDLASRAEFLSIAIPATWPTRYRVFADLESNLSNTIVVSPFDQFAFELIQSSGTNTSFVLFATNLTTPWWGNGWTYQDHGIMSGFVNGNLVLLVDISKESTPELSEKLYRSITQFSE